MQQTQTPVVHVDNVMVLTRVKHACHVRIVFVESVQETTIIVYYVMMDMESREESVNRVKKRNA